MLQLLFIGAVLVFHSQLEIALGFGNCGRARIFVPRIGGPSPVRSGEIPWLVRLNDSNSNHWCTGTLISSEWVLTTSSCFDDFGINPNVTVIAGGTVTIGESSDERKIVKASRVIKHSSYGKGPTNKDFDIALVHLNHKLDGLEPICLIPNCDHELPPASLCLFVGWGTMRSRYSTTGTADRRMHKMVTPVVNATECHETLSNKPDTNNQQITEQMICTGYIGGGMDDCQGDIGAPLMCRHMKNHRYVLQGMDSFAFGCARPGYYHVFSRPCSVMAWINETMRTPPSLKIGDHTFPTPRSSPSSSTTISPNVLVHSYALKQEPMSTNATHPSDSNITSSSSTTTPLNVFDSGTNNTAAYLRPDNPYFPFTLGFFMVLHSLG